MKITLIHIDTTPSAPTPSTAEDNDGLRSAFNRVVGDILSALTSSSSPAEPTPTDVAVVDPDGVNVEDDYAMSTWRAFVFDWTENFGTEGEQPDRPGLLRKYFVGNTGGRLLRYVKSCGGLQAAVVRVLVKEGVNPTKAEQDYIRNVYTNMCAVSSIITPDLADLMEPIDHYAEVR